MSSTIEDVTDQTSHQHGIGNDLRSLRRSRDNRMVAGVLGGLAQRLGVDPVILRIVTAVLTLFGGAGIVLYAIGWLLMPEEGADRSITEQALARGGDSPEPATLWLAGALVVAVLISAGTTFGSGVGTFLLVAAVAGIIVLMRKGADTPPAAAQPDSPLYSEPLDGQTTDEARTVTPAEDTPGDESPDAPTDELTGEEALDVISGDSPAEPTELVDAEPPRDSASYSFPAASARAWPDPPDWPAPGLDQLDPDVLEPTAKPEKPRGSHLGSLTLSAVAVALGILAIVDATTAAIPVSGYVALALAIIGAGLLIGTWFGRSRGLIAWGLIGMFLAFPATVVGDVLDWDLTGEDRTITISNVAAVPEEPRSHGTGRVVYDLRELELADTDERIELDISQNVGSLQVMVPEEADVTVNASTGMGHIAAFEEQAGGHQDIQVIDLGADGQGGGEITLNLDLDVGEILVDRAVDVPPEDVSSRQPEPVQPDPVDPVQGVAQ